MASVSQKTLSWLWDVLQREYRDPQRAYADVAQTLALYPTSAPRTDVYTHENGASALLLNIKGNIPVNFRGSQYRFPVAVWLPHAYPYEPPIFYVAPSEDMLIRPGQHVSPSDGKIYHPYLSRWREAWERSTVADFLRLLADVFAREPPVMSRSQAAGMQNQPAPPPRPPPPNDQRAPPMRPPSVNMNAASQAPPPPPKPNDQIRAGPSPVPNQQRMSRYDAPAPLPNPAAAHRPPSIGSPPVQNYPPQSQSYANPSSNLRQVYPSQQNSGPQMPPNFVQPGQRHSIAAPPVASPPPQMPSPYPQDPRQRQQAFQQPQMPQPGQQPIPYQQPQQQLRQAPQARPPPSKAPQPNIMDDSPFEVTLGTSSANLPTPAIPPNPEKQHILQSLQSTLLTSLQTQISQSSSALAPLQSQHAALQVAQQNLQQELQQLQVLHSQLQQNVESLTSTISAADRTITSARNESSPSKIPSIDDLVIPPTVVARQLYDSVAEQRGYEAAIFALTEGFVRGRIGGEMWARKTRECAREEFRRKWLIKRVGRGMGLDMSQVESSA